MMAVAVSHLGWAVIALAHVPHVVYLIDREGIVLYATGNQPKMMSDFGLLPGSDWSEQAMGTNGAGTALRANRPVAVVGPEQIDSPLDDCTCTGAPLHAPDGTVIGAIGVSTCAADGSPERLVLTAHLAHVIEQELAYRQERRRAESCQAQSLPHTTMRVLAESPDLHDAAPKILRAICEGLGWKWGALWRVDGQTHVLRCVEVWHSSAVQVTQFEARSRQSTFAPDVGLPGRAWASGGPVWVPNVAEDPTCLRAAEAIEEELSSAFAFPIRNESHVLGVVEFFGKDIRQPDDDFLEVMDTIGSQVGQFIGRRQAEEALRRSERQNQVLVDSVPEMVFTCEPDGRCDYCNQRWYDYTGLTFEQTKASGWRSALHPDDLEPCLTRSQEALRTEQPFECEYRLRKADGTYRWFLGRSVPLKDEAGRLTKWFGICTDIDDRKRKEEALKDSDRPRTQFLAMLAHELRNPLAPLANGLDILSLAGADSQAREQARSMMERQIHHLTRLVDDLLEVSRITQGKIQLRQDRLDLARLVRTAAEDRRTVEQAGLTLRVEVPETPVWVTGDATRLTQILDNLLDNAAKFTDRGGSLTVRVVVEEASRQAVVTVHDTGIGIEPDLLPQVFEVFVQADRSLDHRRGGLGLGLSVVKRLVELHGGEIEVFSQGPGQGAAFTFRLPLQMEPAAPSSTASVSVPADERQRVLLIEDNPDTAESLRVLLEFVGHEVRVASSGSEGVQAAGDWRPDVVICDIGLPGKDGYEVARELRRNPALAKARLIAVTGYGSEEDRRRSEDAGFDHHLVKPVQRRRPRISSNSTIPVHAA